jgi:CubicO group peptidase (beta-lactamase class C family)
MTRKPAVLALVAAICFNSTAASAQNPAANPDVAARLRAAEAWLGTQLARDGITGASAAIVHDQQILWSKGYGFANLKGKVPATPSTRYSICSISKLFTSMAAMRERDAGRLNIDAPVSQYLSWYNIRDVEKPEGPVTARAIMSHVAGLPRESDTPYWREAKSELPVQLHGREFAIGYGSRGTGWSREAFPAYKLNAIAPAAGFASTAEDLGKFASWQFRLLATGGADVLRASTLREMHRVHWMTPDKPDETWGLGFANFVHNGKTLVGHSGWCPGYRSALIMRPQDKIAVVLLTNVDDANTGRLTRELYDLIASDVVKAAKTTSPAAPRKADFRAFEGIYGTDRSASDTHVAQLGEELVTISLYQESNVAKGATRWRHAGGDSFRRIREDDSLGEELRFERNRSGRPARLWVHSNPLDRRS